jgi:hypothetical protein
VPSQLQIGSFELPGYREATVEPEAVPRKTTPRKNRESSTRQFHAEGIEFVARPGQAERLRKAIGLTQLNAPDSSDGFVGRLVFVSAEEERLVTVVTLWDGTEDEKRRDESSERVRKLLEPYVDRWLRNGRFVTFFSMPQSFAGGVIERGQTSLSNRVACH